MSSLSASPSPIGPSGNVSLPHSTANNGTHRVDCRYDSSIDNCFAWDSPDTYKPSSKDCCSQASGEWNTTCEVCMFPDTTKSEQQLKKWLACYKGQQNCMYAQHKDSDKENGAAATGPKVKMPAVVFAAALATLA